MLNRNLFLLLLCQLISVTGSVVLVTLGSIIGAQLTRVPALATLPISLAVVVTALSTIPAAMLMKRLGRPLGFALGNVSALVAAAATLWAIQAGSFIAFTGALALLGINMAFAQQYRFAAVECVAPTHAARAVSFILLGAVGGALLGPALVQQADHFGADDPYGWVMTILCGLYLAGAAVALLLRFPPLPDDDPAVRTERPAGEVFRQPLFLVAVFGATSGYGVMSFLMTATPLSMHEVDGFSLSETAAVIRAHVLGMYLPSLFSGWLIDRLGVVRMMSAGAVLLIAALATGMDGHSLGHYTWALILLGVGWNFLYVGGTAMLTYTYRRAERFRAQAVNDFCVFGTAATASLLAGTTMHLFGWFTTAAAPLPLLVLALAALYWIRRDPLLPRAAARVH
ncbi:MAG: MFS transporter [Pseudomonadota bacterium]